MTRLPMAIAAVLIALPCASHAAPPLNLQAKTSNDLADLCGPNPKESGAEGKVNFCHGFAQGVIDMQLRRSGDKKSFCFPTPTPTRTATMNDFTNWVRALSARRTLGSIDGLFQFLGERYPCK